ncbi:MAG TPA: hypothetical protein VFA23_11570 [Dongiaceae bacterium]|nr:hypothetical protein [Dongiaceae bacterium]
MKSLAARFFGTAILYAILGMTLGNVMAATEDHSQLVTHAHMLLIGWVSFAIFGFFYHLFADRAATAMARLHFWLAQASYIAIVVGLFLLFAGSTGIGVPIASIGSMAYLLSMVLFAVIALPVLGARA